MKKRQKKAADEQANAVVDIEDFETVCRVCEAEFLDEADLRLHAAQVHAQEASGNTTCPFCRAKLPGAQEFVTHFIFHHLESCVFCFDCHRVFLDRCLLEQHKMKHLALANDSALACSQCATILTNRLELRQHEQEHADDGDGIMLHPYFSLLSSALCVKINTFIDSTCQRNPFRCRKCKYTSLTLKSYIEHLKAGNCRCFTCDNCFNVYKNKSNIIGHMQQCHNLNTIRDVKKKCTKCNNYFDAKDLSAHKKTCIGIKCFTCLKLFDSVVELTAHRHKEHNASITLFTCKFCKKQFVGSLSLKRHLRRTHKDRRLYKYNCVHCDSIFNHPRRLFAHFYTQHKDIEPYTCKICNKCFRLRKHFTVHIKLVHESVGFVEFDENCHVIFTDKKSDNPTGPQASVDMDSTGASDSESNEDTQVKRPVNKKTKQPECRTNVANTSDATEATKNTDSNINTEPLPGNKTADKIVSNDETGNERENTDKHSPDESDSDVPLSNIKTLVQKTSIQKSNIKKRVRDKRAKLTCKICGKYCYTVQNFHHHVTLHKKSKMKRCIKCNEDFKSRKALKAHMGSSHASSRLIETLKSVLEKRKKLAPVTPSEPFKEVLERRRKQQMLKAAATETTSSKFRRTIKKVDVVDDCTATVTPVMDEGISVKNFIENFKPDEGLNICSSVTLKAVTTPVERRPVIKMRAFQPDTRSAGAPRLRFPVRVAEAPRDDTRISVKLVQQLVTKPSAVNMRYDERVPPAAGGRGDYCNTFADETDYTQYKNDCIPDVAQEVMLEDLDDIPRTRRLAQEVVIPKIAEEHGGVRIGHLLPQAPYFKIVKVESLVKSAEEPDPGPRDIELPDGTRLVSVKNPYSHLIPNDHLAQILRSYSNVSKYYQPKTKNIEKAIAKALCEVKPPRKRGRKTLKKDLNVPS